jgi:hypothetical protein
MEPSTARRLWHLLEPLNAVTYFSPESRDAAVEVGLKGFWMGYFAFRASPLGTVSPGVVEATFFNFHRHRIRRALPDAWALATTDQIISARATSAARALRRHLGDQETADLASFALPFLRAASEAAVAAGRPLFGANRDLEEPDEPAAGLWQLATTLREHRGDGHVALLVQAGLDGCEALVLFAASEGLPPTCCGFPGAGRQRSGIARSRH